MNTAERDRCIREDYVQDRKEVQELARAYGLTTRRIQQIIVAGNIPLRKPRRGVPVSSGHERIGRLLYNYRFDRGISNLDAARDLGWSIIRLRNVERGLADITVTELIDISAYIGRSAAELCKELNG